MVVCDCPVGPPIGPTLASTCGGGQFMLFMGLLEVFLRSQCDLEDPCGRPKVIHFIQSIRLELLFCLFRSGNMPIIGIVRQLFLAQVLIKTNGRRTAEHNTNTKDKSVGRSEKKRK